jgi:hypothetical protein
VRCNSGLADKNVKTTHTPSNWPPRGGLFHARRVKQYWLRDPGHARRASDRLVEMVCEDAVAIVNQELVPVFAPDRLTQLLQHPGGTRMRCDVAMDQTTVAMLDHHERVQQSQRRGDGDEEIAGNESLGVQTEKG